MGGCLGLFSRQTKVERWTGGGSSEGVTTRLRGRLGFALSVAARVVRCPTLFYFILARTRGGVVGHETKPRRQCASRPVYVVRRRRPETRWKGGRSYIGALEAGQKDKF